MSSRSFAAIASGHCKLNRRARRSAVESLEPRRLLSTVVVNSLLDTASPTDGTVTLRSAIATANASSTPTTITFDPTVFATAKTITLGGSELEIGNTSQSVTITGPTAGVTIDGNNQPGGIQVDPRSVVSLSGLNVTHSTTDGISNSGTLTLNNVTVSGNSTPSNGGGIYTSGPLTVTNCTLSGNSAQEGGGGIYSIVPITVSGSTLSGNSATNQGAGIFLHYAAGSSTFTGDTFSGNSASGDGGGFFSDGQQTVVVTNSTFSGNSASQGAGAYLGDWDSTFTFTSVGFTGNIAQFSGGGIYCQAAVSMTRIVISNNSAGGTGLYEGDGSGGGIFTVCDLTLNYVTISSNTASDSGGGFYIDENYGLTDQFTGNSNDTDATVVANNIAVMSNTAVNYGGGVYNGASFQLTDATISSNSINGDYSVGGGFYGIGQTTFWQVTIAYNSSVDGGGGIYLDYNNYWYQNSSLSLVNCTICDNTTRQDGGGIYAADAISIANTIVAGNVVANSSTGPDVYGAVISAGVNLIGTIDGSSGWSGADLTGGGGKPLNPHLGALANNGGVLLTMLPQLGSLTIDNGDNAQIPDGVTTDARGLSRVVGAAVDIGAVEVQSNEDATTDTAAPTAVITAPNITSAGATATVQVVYSDSDGVSAVSIEQNTILVTGPNDITLITTAVSLSPTTDSASITATYTLAAPGNLWSSAANGTYSITTAAAAPPVVDLAGNAVTTATGSFSVNLPPPPAPPPAATISEPEVFDAGNTPQRITVTYSDQGAVSAASITTSNLIVTGPTGTKLDVTAVSLSPTTDAAMIVATYTIAPPSGGWSPSNSGFYSVSMPAGSVVDTSGGGVPAQGTGFTVNVTVAPDTTPPTAAISAPDITTAGGTTQFVTIVYTDATDVQALSINTGNISVTGPAGALTVTGVVLSSTSDAPSITATYSVAAPSGQWAIGDNGTYTVKLLTGQVVNHSDYAANPTQASFAVKIQPTATVVGTAQSGRKPMAFDNGDVTLAVTGGTAAVGQIGSQYLLTLTPKFIGGAMSVTLRVLGGAFTLGNITTADAMRLTSFSAPAATLAGAMTIDGPVGSIKLYSITGAIVANSISSLTANSVSGAVTTNGAIGTVKLTTVTGTIAAGTIIRNFTAVSVSNAQILAGAYLGASARFGAPDDVFSAGAISAMTLGSITNSFIGAGVNPVDGIFGNGNDTAESGVDKIVSFKTKTAIGAGVTIEAAIFPKKVHIPGATAPTSPTFVELT